MRDFYAQDEFQMHVDRIRFQGLQTNLGLALDVINTEMFVRSAGSRVSLKAGGFVFVRLLIVYIFAI